MATEIKTVYSTQSDNFDASTSRRESRGWTLGRELNEKREKRSCKYRRYNNTFNYNLFQVFKPPTSKILLWPRTNRSTRYEA